MQYKTEWCGSRGIPVSENFILFLGEKEQIYLIALAPGWKLHAFQFRRSFYKQQTEIQDTFFFLKIRSPKNYSHRIGFSFLKCIHAHAADAALLSFPH